MAETVLTGKEIKKLPFIKLPAFLGFFNTVFPRFSENFFMGNSPRNTRNRHRENKKPEHLFIKVFHDNFSSELQK